MKILDKLRCKHSWTAFHSCDMSSTYDRLASWTCDLCGKLKIIRDRCKHDWEVVKTVTYKSKMERLNLEEIHVRKSDAREYTARKIETTWKCRGCSRIKTDYIWD